MERMQVRGRGMEETRVPRPKSEDAEPDSGRREEGHKTERNLRVQEQLRQGAKKESLTRAGGHL